MTKTFPSPIRTVEGITEYQLDNGLKVLLFPDTSAQNLTVNLTYLVGSRHEGRGEAGMAHLLEHLLFKGTPLYPNPKAALEDHGATYNATTSFDRTNYFGTFSSTDENLEFALKLEADRMVNSWIRQEDLDAEMTVVRNEFEMGENNPLHVLHHQMFSAAYRWHNYGKATIGNRSDIERVAIKNLKAFYQHYYQPDNAVLIVAGNFKMAKAQEWILQYFGSLPKPTRELDKTYTEEPTQDGPRTVKLLRVGELAEAAVAYHIPAASHPDFAAIMVLSDVLSDEPSGLLYQSLVQSGLASRLFEMHYALKEPGLFMVFARATEDDKAALILDKMQDHLENLSAAELTVERIERAKARILLNFKTTLRSSTSLCLSLSESISQGDYRLFFFTRDQVKTITVDDVLRVATNYFITSNRTSGLFMPISEPKRALIPSTPEVDSLLDGYSGSEEIHPGEEFLATPENIDAHTKRGVLAGTIKTAFISKSTRAQGNLAKLIFRFGDEKTLLGKRNSLRLIRHWLRRGTKDLDFEQVQARLNQLQSELYFYTPYLGVLMVDIGSYLQPLQEVLALTADLVRNPRFSPEEFVLVQQRELANLKAARSDPMQLAMHELNRLKHPFEPTSIHYLPSIDERIAQLKTLSWEEVRQDYQELYGANHLEAAIIGDFDPSVASTLEAGFGTWKSPVDYNRISIPYVPALAELRSLHTPDKQMAVVAMGANLALRDDDPHYPALLMANYIFGESMKSRLVLRLREQEGLSYGAGSTLNVSHYDSAADLTLYAMCATHKADHALKLMQEEYQRWLDAGVSAQELSEGKQSYQLYFNNLLANDGYLLDTLGYMMDVNRNFGFYAQLLKQIEQLKTEDIQKALEIFLKPATVAVVKAGDFKD